MLIFISRKGRKGRRTSNAKLRFRWSSRSLRATEVAKATETIGANTAPARRRALVPSDKSVDSKYNLLTPEKYPSEREICVFREFYVRKKYQSEKRIYFTQNSQNPQNYS